MTQQFFSKNSGDEIMSTSDGFLKYFLDYDFSSVCLKVFFYLKSMFNALSVKLCKNEEILDGAPKRNDV